jgi:hypothetical protein
LHAKEAAERRGTALRKMQSGMRREIYFFGRKRKGDHRLCKC